MIGRLFSAGLLAGCCSTALLAQQNSTVVVPTTNHGVSTNLYSLALEQTGGGSYGEKGLVGPYVATEMAQKHGPLVGEATTQAGTVNAPTSTPALQSSATRTFGAQMGANFEGPGQGMAGFTVTGAPPDTTMAVGPNHIVAWVNSQYAIYSKNGTPLLPGNGFVNGNTLFAGTGNSCETTNQGDPILQYDRLADRWVLSQFAFTINGQGVPSSPYYQCFAISTSGNPLGTYVRYSVQFSPFSPSGFNDYGKLGIWPDGYYTTYNIFAGTPAGSNSGTALCVSDRTAMLAGTAAASLCAPIGFYGGGASFLPADMDGTTMPTTLDQGNIVMRYSFGGRSLRILKLKPNFANNTLTLNDGLGGSPGSFVNFPVGSTLVACEDFADDCIRQPGTTTTLDSVADRLMYRLAYRNRGGLDSLVVNQSVDPDGTGPRSSAIKWFEIRQPFTASPVLFQNSIWDPGGTGDRWMGSIAMDKMGNMLMGYSVVNADAGLKPSLRVAGRLRSDLRNQLQAESTMIIGSGSQTTRSNGTALTRWGDYTTMQIDPSDDCTFWYIGQYLANDGVFNWRTRIASYKFNGCK